MFDSQPFRPLTSNIILLTFLCFIWWCCDASGNRSSSSPKTVEKKPAYAEMADSNAAVRYNMLGDSAMGEGNYPAAIKYYQLSVDTAGANADSFPYYDSQLDMASVHARMGEYTTAVQITEPVIAAFIRSGDSARIGLAYSTLAGFYDQAGMPDKMQEAARNGLNILKNYGSLVERGAAYNQMAFAYSSHKNWAEALPFLDSALLLMKASGEFSQIPALYLNLGNCHRNLQNWSQAQHCLQQSVHLADSLGQTHVQSIALLRLSQIAESTGDYPKAIGLFKTSAALKDTVFNHEKIANLQELEVAHQTKEKEYLISKLQLEHEATIARRNLVYALSLLAFVVLGFGLLQVRARLNHSRESLLKYQKDLNAFTELLRTKNIQLAELENAIQRPDHTPPPQPVASTDEESAQDSFSEEQDSLFNSRILTFDDWEIFKYRFEQAYPGYILRLRTTYPEITSAEERLFLLIKLGLNSQEIAGTLGISANGVKKGRQRLRKKLNLQTEDDLDKAIVGF